MRISDWSSDVCSSDLSGARGGRRQCRYGRCPLPATRGHSPAPAPTAGATPAPIASQLVGRLGEIVAVVGRAFGGFPLLHAVLGHQLSENVACDATHDTLPAGPRHGRARNVVQEWKCDVWG